MAARRRTQKVNDALGWLHHAPRSSEVGAARAGLFLQIHNLYIPLHRQLLSTWISPAFSPRTDIQVDTTSGGASRAASRLNPTSNDGGLTSGEDLECPARFQSAAACESRDADAAPAHGGAASVTSMGTQ